MLRPGKRRGKRDGREGEIIIVESGRSGKAQAVRMLEALVVINMVQRGTFPAAGCRYARSYQMYRN